MRIMIREVCVVCWLTEFIYLGRLKQRTFTRFKTYMAQGRGRRRSLAGSASFLHEIPARTEYGVRSLF